MLQRLKWFVLGGVLLLTVCALVATVIFILKRMIANMDDETMWN